MAQMGFKIAVAYLIFQGVLSSTTPPKCNLDDCLLALQHTSSVAIPFCATYTAQIPASTAIVTPNFASRCSKIAATPVSARLSSACSCLTPASTTSTSSVSLSTSSSTSRTSSTSSASSIPHPTATVRPNNIVLDPGFEDADSSSWYMQFSVIDSTTSYSGFNSTKMSRSAQINQADVPIYNFALGSTLYWSFAAKLDNSNSAAGSYCFLSVYTSRITLWSETVTSPFDWTVYSGSFTVVDFDRDLTFRTNCNDPNWSLWVDDVYIGPTSS